jgi:CRP-like cAMP-binding protein
MSDDAVPLNWLTKKLERLGELGDEDRAAIAALPCSIEQVPPHRHLVREGSAPAECCVLVDGFAFRDKVAAGGARQIVSFHIRGDILDLQHLLLATADHNVRAMGQATVGWIPKEAVRALALRRPAVAEALWRDTLIDASIFREWVLNVGRRDAKSRIAHMLSEFLVRCQAAGLGSAERVMLPMTQEQIADAVGLTPVHVNRMLRALEEDGVIERAGREIRVADWALMKRVADFDPAYLHAAAA